jgi:acyl-CoA reductase-like NAD-dependent aldehyde dehydrogenase
MTRQTLQARNPLTGEHDYRFEIATRDDVAATCAAVRAAQPGWVALGAEGRGAALLRLAESLRRHEPAMFAALSIDTGRRRIARIETQALPGLIALTIEHAKSALAPSRERPSIIPGIAGRQQHVPIPVVGNIAPWNFPLLLSMIDTIPALMAGCAVVIKPSEVTPRYVEPLREALDAVPEIAAVTAIVRGPGSTGADLVDHVDAVVLTGSVRTGRRVAEHAARRFIPAFLELGGKDAVIVTRSADIERAATAALRASISASGQACQSLERVYVDRGIFAPFLARVLEQARAVRTTAEDPAGGQIGPFIMARQAEIVREHIADAVAQGARVECGGRIVERGGVWCEATVLTNVDHRMKIMTEETFGPVMPIMPFDTIDEAIRLANEGDYGLSANVLAGSEAEANAIAERLDAGFVSINDVSMSSFVSDFEWEGFRFSGLGRSRMGPSGIARYLRTKAIVTNRGPTTPLAGMADA